MAVNSITVKILTFFFLMKIFQAHTQGLFKTGTVWYNKISVQQKDVGEHIGQLCFRPDPPFPNYETLRIKKRNRERKMQKKEIQNPIHEDL